MSGSCVYQDRPTNKMLRQKVAHQSILDYDLRWLDETTALDDNNDKIVLLMIKYISPHIKTLARVTSNRVSNLLLLWVLEVINEDIKNSLSVSCWVYTVNFTVKCKYLSLCVPLSCEMWSVNVVVFVKWYEVLRIFAD